MIALRGDQAVRGGEHYPDTKRFFTTDYRASRTVCDRQDTKSATGNRRRGVLPRRRVYEQQEAETEGGEQAREARTIVEGLGNHRFGGHREQRAGSKRL